MRSWPLGRIYVFRFFNPTRWVGNYDFDAAMGRFLYEDLELPSDPIRQIQESPGGCVKYSMRRVGLRFNISIDIRQWKGLERD